MAYNLIDERWIPVRRRSGKVERIAPAEIADRADPPIDIESPRPDFDGALLEFLIGLLQTAAAPATERAWAAEFENPPEPSALKKRLNAIRAAFFLDGDGPRFMQDLTVAADPKAAQEPIGALLIDRVGESGLGDKPTLFAKPGGHEALGFPAAAAALMTLQSYAPSGGAGHRTSLRGGGPLTTVVCGTDLWGTVWLNVLPKQEFEARVRCNAGLSDRIFPWMRATLTEPRPTTPDEIHPTQQFWGLPRRFRLVFAEGDAARCCISGEGPAPVVRAFSSRPQGINYKGDFRHPFTPYSRGKPGEPWNPKKGSENGLPYRDWPLLVSGTEERAPAIVVSYFREKRRDRVESPRLRVFGFAMDNMKPLRWVQATTPLIAIAEELTADFSAAVERLVEASEEVRRTFAGQVKAAWSDRPKDLPGDAYARLDPAFWSRTEPAFFAAVEASKNALESGGLDASRTIRETWLAELHRSALALFDIFAGPSADLATSDLRRAVLARRDLERYTSPNSRSLRETLQLPVEIAAAKKPRGKRPKEAR